MESHEKNAKDLANGLGQANMNSLEMRETTGTPTRRLKDLDDLLQYVGGFGWYQRILFLLMIPYAFFFAFVYFGQIFMTVVPAEHWCYVPELGNLSLEERRHLSIPLSEDKSFKFDKCRVYNVNWTKILEANVRDPDPSWPTVKCQQWEFNYSDIPYETIATQQGWVCDRDSYPATAQAIFFCGAILGGLIFGWVADKYGRIPALIGTNLAGFAGGIGTVFTNTFWSFCLCRFIVGLAYDNCFIIMYIIVVEYVGPKWRTFVANMSIAAYFTFAACLLPWIALATADWRIYTLIISTPLALVVLTPWLVPESARWLISQGRIEEAIKIMRKVEKMNGKKIPDDVIAEFRETATDIAKAEQECKNYSVLDLFKTPRLRKNSILLIFIWISISMVFDGHVRNVGALGLDMFLTFTVATATEFPADILLILTLDVYSDELFSSNRNTVMCTLLLDGGISGTPVVPKRLNDEIYHQVNILGRRWLAFGSMLVSGIFSLAAAAVPIGLPSASLAIVGRFAVNISFNIGMQYAAELLPTVVRAQGLALIHITGYIATILVPYIVYMGSIATEIPLIILGTLGILGGCLCLLLPESMGVVMPQTIQDGEDYGRGQRLWDCPACSSKKNEKEPNTTIVKH